MNLTIRTAWNTVFERFYCPETELVYDFVIDDENSAWFHLPSVEDIKNNIPNPCGWGTGMEDSVLNGGSLIEALVSAYRITGEAEIKPLVNTLMRGLLRCAESENKGFIARSISPFDGKTHYIESSRDQYTHWVYSALKFYDSGICEDGMRDKVREVLVNIAEKCERDVTPQNDYVLLRENNTPGMVTKMWGELSFHEWLRLPMFYLAAYRVSGDNHWYELYMKLRDTAFDNSVNFDPDKCRCYGLLQMQYSLRALYDYDNDEAFCMKILDIMNFLAECGEKKSIETSVEFCREEHCDDINFRFRKWNEIDALDLGIFEGYRYINPAQSERRDNPAFYPVREVAEAAVIAAICPGRKISAKVLEAVDNMAEAIDYKKHSSVYSPLLMVCAHILCRENLEY